jgi:hypothetical protein
VRALMLHRLICVRGLTLACILRPKPKALYHIRRTTEDITHTVQVKSVVSSLNSKDAFVLLTQDVLYLWYVAKPASLSSITRRAERDTHATMVKLRQ